MIVVSSDGDPRATLADAPATTPTVQALWLDGWLRSAGLPAPWSYRNAPSRRALAAWREGWHHGHEHAPRAHAAGCPGVTLDTTAETVAPCSVCSPAPHLAVVAS